MRIINSYFPGIPAQRSDGIAIAEFCAVCTVDDSGLYAVYVGLVAPIHTDLRDYEPDPEKGIEYQSRRDNAAEFVAHHGLKR
jgi:hypothetical protein